MRSWEAKAAMLVKLGSVEQAEQAQGMVWLTGPGGEPRFFNRRCLDYFGLGEGDTAGWHWQWAVHPADLVILRRAWTKALRSGEPCDAKFRLRRTDGAYRWHLGSLSPLRDDQGQVTGWM